MFGLTASQAVEATPFMDSIRANLADNLPRLVFADWLEERRHDMWADFIRVSIRREGEMLLHPWEGVANRYYAEVTANDSQTLTLPKYSRGFISSVDLRASVLRQKGAKLYAMSALEQVSCLDIKPYHIYHTGDRYGIAFRFDVPVSCSDLFERVRKEIRGSGEFDEDSTGAWWPKYVSRYAFISHYQTLNRRVSTALINYLKEMYEHSRIRD